MIQLQEVTLRRGSKVLLEEAEATVYAKQKVGFVGANGAGKSSMFALLQGTLEPDQGKAQVPKHLRMAHIAQEMPDSMDPAVEYVMHGDTELKALQEQLKVAEANEDGMAVADIYIRMGEIDAYDAESRAAKVLVGLGFAPDAIYDSVNEFSGGWRMRLNLAQVLMARADILLLDEPTNHLDLESILWLEDWLQRVPQTCLIVSHDRSFLDAVCSHIIHLRDQKLFQYTGNYSRFEKEYAMQLSVQQSTHLKQEKQRAHLQKFVDRFSAKASKAKQAQSRVKMLEKMDRVEAVHRRNSFRFAFEEAPPGGNPMLQLDRVDVGYNDDPVLMDVRFSLSEGDRIGLIGMNGAGKSTLIKLLAGKLKEQSGKITRSTKLNVGYFAQHQLDQLDADATSLHTFMSMDPKLSEGDARKYLGRFHFSRDRVFQKVGSFSGGEKSRLALALLIHQKPNVLLLDEPTNHLDMEMREALTLALQSYAGAVVVISHDRHLLESTVDTFWLIDNGEASVFNGDLEDYHNKLRGR